jgi:hypothetical protein
VCAVFSLGKAKDMKHQYKQSLGCEYGTLPLDTLVLLVYAAENNKNSK